MAPQLIGTIPSLKSVIVYIIDWTIGNIFQLHLNQNTKIIIAEN